MRKTIAYCFLTNRTIAYCSLTNSHSLFRELPLFLAPGETVRKGGNIKKYDKEQQIFYSPKGATVYFSPQI